MRAAPPTASLSGVTFSRRTEAPFAPDKSGDITDRLVAAVPPAIAPERPPPAPRPAPPPAPKLVPEAAHPAPERQVELAPRAEGIAVHWERLRRGRPCPSLVDLDRGLVGASWPGTLLVAFEGGDEAMPRIARLGTTDGAIEYTPMVTDWILARARVASRRAMMLDEMQSFPIEGDMVRYRMLQLPFVGAGTAGNCVLCHLSLAD